MKILIWLFSFIVSINAYASDLAIGSTINSPMSGCNLTTTEDITITIINAATSAYSGTFAVSYTVNSNPTVTQNITVPVLNVGGTYIYTFPVTADFSTCGIHSIVLNVNDAGDVNSANNTLTVNITSDCNPSAGTFSGPSTVCETGNAGQIDLTGNTGIISHWTFSDDGGASFTSTGNTAATQTFSNITTPRLYRVFFDSQYGFCPSDSADYSITVDLASNAGTLSSDSSHCDTILPTTLYLSGYNGNVVNYQLSLNGGTTFSNFTNPYDTLQYVEYGSAFQFFAVTQNGSCPVDSSNIVFIDILPEPEAGEITGQDSLCAGESSTDLNLINYTGNIVDWEYSTDNGTTWIGTGLTADNVTLSSITANSKIRVIVENQPCGSDTAFLDIVLIPASDAGIAVGETEYCSETNAGYVNTSVLNGTISGWISTTDNGSTFVNIADLNDTLYYTNLTQTTSFAAIVQFGTCPPDTSNFVTITINEGSFVGTIVAPDTVCAGTLGNDIALANNIGEISNWLYSEDNGLTWISLNTTDTTIQFIEQYGSVHIMAIVQNANCPPDTSIKSLFIHGPFDVFTLEDTITAGDSLQLDAGTGVNFEWSPNIYISNNTSSNPKVSPPIDTEYQVVITDTNGCSYSSSHKIFVLVHTVIIEANNILTPNGDGFNDIWLVKNIELFPKNTVKIFDRYGQIIFEASPYLNDWDATGDNLPDGTYFYIINTDPDLSPERGTITVINSK